MTNWGCTVELFGVVVSNEVPGTEFSSSEIDGSVSSSIETDSE